MLWVASGKNKPIILASKWLGFIASYKSQRGVALDAVWLENRCCISLGFILLSVLSWFMRWLPSWPQDGCRHNEGDILFIQSRDEGGELPKFTMQRSWVSLWLNHPSDQSLGACLNLLFSEIHVLWIESISLSQFVCYALGMGSWGWECNPLST